MDFARIAKKRFPWIACEPIPAPKPALLAINFKMILKYRFIIYFLFLAVLIFIDQLSKYAVHTNKLPFFKDSICNSGIAFSINLPAIIFWTLWIVAVALLIFLLFKKNPLYGSFFIVFILAGTLSNIFDRIRFGCVTDFIALPMWPVFNLADIYITIGAMVIITRVLLKKTYHNTKF